MPSISFFFNEVSCPLSKRKRLKAFIPQIFKDHQKQLGHVTYVFCSDAYLLTINQSFLNHDFYTDIITFDLSEAGPVVGEIYISVDRVKENAKTNGVNMKRELHRVIFHGILHLCGLKDKAPSQERNMRVQEEKYLARYF